jgi:uncharacterized protein
MTDRLTRHRRRFVHVCAVALITLALSLGGLAARAEPALWRVQGPHATVYLFGTVHVLRPTVVWRSERIDRALKSADSLWLEVTDAENPAVMQPLINRLGLDPATPLSARLDPDTNAELNVVLASLGASAANLQPMKPWLAGVTLDLLPLVRAGYDPAAGVEKRLTNEAKIEGKSLHGFETIEQQIHYLADMPLDLQIQFLKSEIREADKAMAETDDMVFVWSNGDDVTLGRMLNGEMRDAFPEVYRRLIVERNRRFAARIAELLKGRGVSFVAVGAAHLAGDDSVQVDLARMGYKAERQ